MWFGEFFKAEFWTAEFWSATGLDATSGPELAVAVRGVLSGDVSVAGSIVPEALSVRGRLHG